jgi:hypothetical protein
VNFVAQVSLLLERWKEIKVDLTELFKDRKQKETMALMLEAIEIFEKFLLLSNEVETDNSFFLETDLKCSPINVTERLAFIKNRPSLFHSFAQLSELMNEQEKQYHKQLAIKKATKHDHA